GVRTRSGASPRSPEQGAKPSGGSQGGTLPLALPPATTLPAQVMALAGGWVLADMARQFVLTGFPWNPLGSGGAVRGWLGDVMFQPASWVSVQGLTLATVLLACAPALRWRGRAACFAVFLAWIGFGVSRTAGPPPPDQNLTVVLVQGNVAQGQK